MTDRPSPAYPSWAKGFKVEELRAQAALFKAHDRGLVLGAFSGVRERDVASWRAKGQFHRLEKSGELFAAVVVAQARQDRAFEDFAGRRAAWAHAGSSVVTRMAWKAGNPEAALALLDSVLRKRQRPRVVLESWMEHEGERKLLEQLGARWRGTKVTAASELRGYFELGPRAGLDRPADLPFEPDLRTLCRLALPLWEPGWMAEVAAKVGQEVTAWADHYAAAYNKGHTWKAVALRGFGGLTEFIEKPAEMSKGWKEANREKLAWGLSWTPLWGRLREYLEPLVESVPGVKHRVRLMQLLPGGLIGRHADITDPTAGTAPLHTMRIHIPLATEEACRFRSWSAQGELLYRHMGVGETWYIDTRKPHSVVHEGERPRVHLVMDVESCPMLLHALPAAD